MIKKPIIALVRGYQLFLSPLLPGSCKYHPSCSQYAIDAVQEHGVLRGAVLAAWRVLRCNPFSHGGHDPVERQRVFRPHVESKVSVGLGPSGDRGGVA